jgi:hypothetical protein
VKLRRRRASGPHLRRPRGGRPSLLLVAVLAMAVMVPGGAAQRARVTVTVDPGTVVATSRLQPGLTHGEHSADPWNDPAAVAAAERLLARRPRYQNQHIMGWGTLNPEPSPGVYDFASLDRRVELIRRTRGIPVLTLCCAPDWMKGGPEGATDWSRLEEAPDPDHYDDFASLAAVIARRYPDVRHYQVWNELKGFWNEEENRWDHEGYTKLYNMVYDELKSVDPAIQVGGPYVVIDLWSGPRQASDPSRLRGAFGTVDQRSLDVIDYWLAHRHGADFIALDMSTDTNDRGRVTGEFAAVGAFSAVTRWLRTRTSLPLWWAEWYPLAHDGNAWPPTRQAAVLAAGLVEVARTGSQVALLWDPQAHGQTCDLCLWTDTTAAGGGQPTPAMQVLEEIAITFPPGTPLVATKVSSPQVTALSSPTRTLLVNHLDEPLGVAVDGRPHWLAPYETRVVARSGDQAGRRVALSGRRGAGPGP